MKYKSQGYVLLELLISLVIAGMISAALIAAIMQLTDVDKATDNLTSIYGRLAIFQNQMQRDIMGAFVPTQYNPLHIPKDPKATDDKEPQKIQPLEKIFIGTSQENTAQFESLTFITDNPLQIFAGVKNAAIKPRIARVVYRLLPGKRKHSFTLWRQEGSTDLHFEKYKQDAQGEFRSFPLIDGIREMTIHYLLTEQASKKKDEKESEVSYVHKRQTSWKDQEEKKDQKKYPGASPPYPKLPHAVEIELSLWDIALASYKTYTMTIPIESRYQEFEKEAENKEKEPGSDDKEKKEDAKPEAEKEKPAQQAAPDTNAAHKGTSP